MTNRALDGLVLTVDPGLSGTGYCLWNYKEWKRKKVLPIAARSVIPQKVKGQALTDSLLRGTECATLLFREISQYLHFQPLRLTIIEYPKKIFNQAIAERNTPSGIAFTAGAVTFAAESLKSEVQLIDVIDWKGNMPKVAAWEQAMHAYPMIMRGEIDRFLSTNRGEHHWDAFGIGVWAQGWM